MRRILANFCVLLFAATGAFAGQYILKPLNPPSFPKNPTGGTIYWNQNSAAYGTVGSGYGATTAEHVFYGECVGTITTTYVWVRAQIADPGNPGQMIDDPLDNPPEEVIVYENIFAMASALSNSGGVYAESDSGLGFQTQTGGDPNWAWSHSFGTRYLKRTGGPEIVLTCSPSAFAMSDEEGAWVHVGYTSAIILPTVNLIGTTRFSAPHSIKFLTGQQITASITMTTTLSGTAPPIATYSWRTHSDNGDDIDIFKSYTHTTTLGKKYAHTPTDLSYQTFPFFSLNDGEFRVECDLVLGALPGVRYDGGLPAFTAKSLTVESVRPDAAKGTVANGTVNLWNNPQSFLFGDPNNGQDGQDWKDVGFDPSPFAQSGQGCFVQLITANRHLYRNAPQGYYTHFTYQKTAALDANFPYPYSVPTWNLPNTGRFYDSPAQALAWNPGDGGGADWYRATANDSFKTWAMFKPPPAYTNQITTWIPMIQYEWAWNGEAQKQGGVWALIAGNGGWTVEPRLWEFHPEWNTFSPSVFVPWGIP